MTRLVLVLLVSLPACGLLPGGTPREAPPPPIGGIEYRVWIHDRADRELEVELSFQAPGRDVVLLGLPAWTLVPEIRDLRRFVSSLTARDGVGRSLQVQFAAKDLWRVFLQGNDEVHVRYRVKATDEAPVGNQLTDDFAYLVGGSTFVYVVDGFDRPISLTIEPPEGWQVVTPLASTDGGSPYLAERYDDLIEHPIAMGRFRYFDFDLSGEIGGVSRSIRMQLVVDSRREESDSDLARFRDGLRAMGWEHLQLMRRFPFPTKEEYLFLLLLEEEAPIDSFGFPRATVLTGAPRDLEGDALELLRAASREFGHLWFGGRVPKGDANADLLGREFYSMVYWAIYGWGSYYGDLLLVRAGLLSPERFLASLAEDIAVLRECLSHSVLSPAASSYLIWFYRYPDWAEAQAGVHPRHVGRLLALALDLFIRETTVNNKSLDTVVRELEDLFVDLQRRLTIQDVVDALSRNLGQPVLRTFGKHLYGTEEPLWDEYLRWVGLHLEPEVLESGIDPGFLARELFPGRFFVVEVFEEGPARRTGLATGDEILTIDGEASAATAEVLAGLEPGENLELRVRHSDGRVEEFTVDVRARLVRRLHISDLPAREATSEQRESWKYNRQLWLGPASGPNLRPDGSDPGR